MITLLQSLPEDEERRRALAAAAAACGLGLQAPKSSLSDPPDAQEDEGQSNTDDPKKFIQAKKPASDRELVACLGYFLTNMRNTSTFGAKELEKLNNEARGNIIGEFRFAVANATGYNRYFKSAGKGKKKITPHGDQSSRHYRITRRSRKSLLHSRRGLAREQIGRRVARRRRSRGAILA